MPNLSDLKQATKETTQKFDLFSDKVYIAKVISVTDGDTIIAAINLFKTLTRVRVRFLDVNTPEIRGAEREQGLKYKKFVEDKIMNKLVVLETKGQDAFGRVLATIRLLESTSLNDQLADMLQSKEF